MRALVAFASLLVACGGSSGPATNLSSDQLCTTLSCAQVPCAPGCVFVSAPTRSCTKDYPNAVERTFAASCAEFCGLFGAGPSDLGCRRFDSANPACASDCHLDGAETCYPKQADIDYGTGGAICDRVQGYFCKSGEPGDLSRGACLDSGQWGP